MLLVLSTALLCITVADAVTEGHIQRIKTKLIDETQYSNPKSFDYNFDDDARKPADRNDIYDELVPLLPTFILHKNGKDIGRTKVPIVTRKLPVWSTRPPPTRRGNQLKEWFTFAPPVVTPPRIPFHSFRRVTTRRFTATPRPRTTTPRPRSQTRTSTTRQTVRPFRNNVGSTRRLPGSSRLISSDKRAGRARNVIRSIKTHPSAKPLVVNIKSGPYKGPTYNCPVLTPLKDGRPSTRNVRECRMSKPGVSADGRCQCTYEASSRDENGCARGFLYTCTPI